MNEISSLEQINVANPCTMDWDLMDGDDKKRFCQKCQKNVFNFSAMTKQESLEILNSSDSVCGRLTRRRDGTLVSGDCPPPASQSKKSWFQFSLSGLLILLTCSAALCGAGPYLQKRFGPYIDQWFGKTVAEETERLPTEPIDIAEPPDTIVGDIILEPFDGEGPPDEEYGVSL